MKNKKAEAVIEKIKFALRDYTLKILGDRENKASAFYIMTTVQYLSSDKMNIFHGIKQSTLDLLDEADITYKILNG